MVCKGLKSGNYSAIAALDTAGDRSLHVQIEKMVVVKG